MQKYLQFSSRGAFRTWLTEHAASSDGVWLLFGKSGGPTTIKADEALEEALCFGWIDGQMKSLDKGSYIKYFSQRRNHSKWSKKNKTLVEALEKQGIMTELGREKIRQAKENGQWAAQNSVEITDEQIMQVSEILREYEPAYTNFASMSPSVRKTYTRAYLDAKTEAGRAGRLSWMIERLNQNLKPM